MLLAEGLVEEHEERGVMARTLTPSDAEEVMSLRAVIDGFAARLAAENIDEEKAAGLRLRLDRLLSFAGTQDHTARIEADLEIHRFIVECSGHGLLKKLYSLLENQVRLLLLNVGWIDFSSQDIGKQHRALTEAICDGNAAAAAAAALYHSREVRRIQTGSKKDDRSRGLQRMGGEMGLRRNKRQHPVGTSGETDD